MTGPGRTTAGLLFGRLAWLSFGVLIVLSPFRVGVELSARSTPPISTFYTQFVLTWADIAVLATIGLWIVSLVLDRRRVDFGPAVVAVPVAGLLTISWLGVPTSVDPALTGYQALRLLLVVALALYVLNEVKSADRLATPIVIMIAIQAVVVLGQLTSQQAVGLWGLGEQRVDPSTAGVSVVVAEDGTRLLRAYGLTLHPNVLGGILAFALLTLGSALGRTRGVRGVRAVAFAIGVVVLLMTFSRAAWLAFAVGSVVAVAMLASIRDRSEVRRRLAVTFAGVLLCVPLIVPLAPYLAARANITGPLATEVRSIDERVALAGEAVDIFIERPLLGSGLGTLPTAIHIDDPTFGWGFLPAHVVALLAAAETGIVGLLSYLLIVIAPWLLLIRDRARWTPWLAGASAALAAVTIVGLFDHYTWTPSGGRIWAWIALGVWVAAYRAAMRGRRDA